VVGKLVLPKLKEIVGICKTNIDVGRDCYAMPKRQEHNWSEAELETKHHSG